jgi:ABC-type transport system involved in cytochrome bd biosynthesis fused ATPase/permease subunit
MRMSVIFVVAIVAIAAIFYLLDRGLKAVQRGRRTRDAAYRLNAVARKAEREHREHKAEQEVSTALTSVLPAIIPEESEDRGPRAVA